MAELTITDCVSIWNGDANADVRVAAAAMRPREVFVAVKVASGGVNSPSPPPGCFVYFRDPGDGTTPPTMLSIPTTADAARFDLTLALRYRGVENTRVTGLPEAILADDGMMTLGSPGHADGANDMPGEDR